MQIKAPELLLGWYQKAGLGDLFSRDMSAQMALHRFRRGEFINREFKPIDRLYFLVQGRVKVSMTEKNGKVILVDFCDPPGIFGDLELLGGQDTTHAIEVVEAAVCLSLPVAECREALLSDPVFMRAVATQLAERMVRNWRAFSSSQAFALRGRLAEFILMSSDGDSWREKLTDTALYLRVSYRHLVRVIAQLCDSGALEKTGRRYRISDRAMLRRLADEIYERG